jgi:hypothetical protein
MSPERTQSEAAVRGLDAWLAIASGQDRSHGGNDGYEDDPAHFYSWDTTVPNYASVKAGDVLVLRDRRTLLGASVIEEVETGEADKAQYVCPSCRKGRGIGKPRLNRSPAFLCQECGAEFDELVKSVRRVTTYRSRHDVGWVDLAGLVEVSQLRLMCEKPKSQLSIRRLRWPLFRAAIGAAVDGMSLTPLEFRVGRLAGGHSRSSVRVRVGQAGFRERLLGDYGPVCAFTGPAPLEALQACHLYSYSAVGVHHADGGLMLRSDLHGLFDSGLLAVDPRALTIDARDALARFPAYADLHGQPLQVAITPGTRRWLEIHWAEHRQLLP